MPDEWGALTWHGFWAPEHPVRARSYRGSSTIYLSVEDAVERIYSSYFGDTPQRPEIEKRLRSGEAVLGYRLLKEAP